MSGNNLEELLGAVGHVRKDPTETPPPEDFTLVAVDPGPFAGSGPQPLSCSFTLSLEGGRRLDQSRVISVRGALEQRQDMAGIRRLPRLFCPPYRL